VDRTLPPDQRVPVGKPRVAWGIGDFVWIYFAGIVASIVGGQIGIAITGDDPGKLGGVTTALILAGQFGGWVAGLVWVSRRKGRGTLRADFGLVVRLRDAWVVLVGVGLEIGLAVVVQPLVNLANNEHQSVVKDLEDARGLKLAALALAAGLVAPVCEELLFRGLLLRSLARRLPPAPAVAIAALVFALAHLLDPTLGTLAVVPALFALGALSGVLALQTGDLSRSIMLHVGFNLLTTVAAIHTALNK
jgi:membrane protease YdiL (CAAX protease family)